MSGLFSRIVNVRELEELNRMFRSAHGGTRAIAAAISAMMNHRLDDDERAWIGKITSLEKEVASKVDEMITFTDFGAGDPGANLTEEQMAQGRRITRSFAHI